MSEPHDIRMKRLRMRSWRRGTKEMDMILGPFSDGPLSDLTPDDLDLYERLLAENDQDLYQWVSEQSPAPDEFATLIGTIRVHAKGG